MAVVRGILTLLLALQGLLDKSIARLLKLLTRQGYLRKELERLCRYIIRPAIADEWQLWRNSNVSCGSIAEIRRSGKQPSIRCNLAW